MPRYFFDVCDESGWHQDHYGVELDTVEEAREQAISLLPDIARDELPGGDRHDIRCEIRNAANRVIYRGELSFRGWYVDDLDRRQDDGLGGRATPSTRASDADWKSLGDP